MKRQSTLEILGIPDEFGLVLLIFCFILFLASFVSGSDFGIFKVPDFNTKLKKKMKYIGPFCFLLSVLLFIPVWSSPKIIPPTTPKGEITLPENGAQVEPVFNVMGTLENIPNDHYVWLAIQIGDLRWPKEATISASDQRWSVEIEESGESGKRFSVVLLLVTQEGNTEIEEWISRGKTTGKWPGLNRITGGSVLDIVSVRLE